MPTVGDIVLFLSGQYFGRTWMPDVNLTGKTIVVTGGNTGLGFDCAKHLVRNNVSKAILACRNFEKGQAAKASIVRETKCNENVIEVWQVDLDHFDSVKAFNERVNSQLVRLDGFVANAGLELRKFEASEGCERSLTVDVITTYLVAFGALPKLKATASEYKTRTNLCLVGSMVHVFGPDAQLNHSGKDATDTFDALSDPKIADMQARYPLSKLIEHLCYLELASRLPSGQEGVNVTVNIVNPGWCKTELSRYKGSPLIERIMAGIFQRTSEEGSRTLVHGVTADRTTHGKYLSECQVKEMSAFVRSARSTEIQQRLYAELVARLEKISPGVTAIAA